MSKMAIAVKQFALGGRVSLETVVNDARCVWNASLSSNKLSVARGTYVEGKAENHYYNYLEKRRQL